MPRSRQLSSQAFFMFNLSRRPTTSFASLYPRRSHFSPRSRPLRAHPFPLLAYLRSMRIALPTDEEEREELSLRSEEDG